MKEKIITFTFISYILFFSILHIILPDKSISNTERRTLANHPELKLTNEYITKVDKYLLDHFPYRDTFRSIKAKFNYNILNKLDNNDIYLKDNYIFKSNYPTNNKSINNFINKSNKILNNLTPNNNTYIMVIPDKNYYLKENIFLTIDYNYIYNQIDTLGITPIDIRNILELNDYYEIDTHWRQENLFKVVEYMDTIMNFNYIKYQYNKNTFNYFYGVYYGESAINRNPEELTYLTNNILTNATVKYLENNNLTSIYNLDKLTSLDSYEVYLDGASSYIEITNPSSTTSKELVIFRDSFASSITPLLIPYYSKITLIDNRYINSTNFSKLIKFTNQDIILMYSTLIINNSSSLKG